MTPPLKTPPKGALAGGDGEGGSPLATPPKGTEGRTRRSSRESLQRSSTKVLELHLPPSPTPNPRPSPSPNANSSPYPNSSPIPPPRPRCSSPTLTLTLTKVLVAASTTKEASVEWVRDQVEKKLQQQIQEAEITLSAMMHAPHIEP